MKYKLVQMLVKNENVNVSVYDEFSKQNCNFLFISSLNSQLTLIKRPDKRKGEEKINYDTNCTLFDVAMHSCMDCSVLLPFWKFLNM